MVSFLKKVFDKISTLYFYGKLGWGNYISLILGASAYLTIIYTYIIAKFIPTPDIYLFIGIACFIAVISIICGYLARKSGFWGKEHWMSTISNPALDKPTGKKDILAYDAGIVGLEVSIMCLENQLDMNSKLGIDNKKIMDALEKQKNILEKMRDMRNSSYSSEGVKLNDK